MTSATAFLLAACSIVVCHLGANRAAAQAPPPRERLPFNDGWRFVLGDTPEAGDVPIADVRGWLAASAGASTRPVPTDWSFASPTFDDSAWRSLRLPHDWAIEGPFVQALPGETGKRPFAGVAWYRKSFDLAEADMGRSLFLDVDGAMSHATVWINGRFAGGWPYGYTSFRIDVSPHARPGRNVVAIRLQNPPDSSRWYPGAGIYRNVWLVKASPVHVGQWGVFVTTPQVAEDAATVRADVTIENASEVAAKVTTHVELFEADATGRALDDVLTSTSADTMIEAGDSATATHTLRVERPKRWSIQTPYRYVARVRVEQDGRTVDAYDQPFGIRTIEFKPDDGFHLNGQRVPLHGVCEHHDLGALGTAFNVRAMERKLQILQSMGVNALRTSHNPPAPEVLELCDRMGIVVFNEAFDCWRMSKKPNDYGGLFDVWHERDVAAFVRRDRNHPSVVAWSTGNEILEQGHRGRPPTTQGVAIGKHLSELFKREDPTRPTTVGFNQPTSAFNEMRSTADVLGFNYKPELYGRFQAETPTQPYLGSETASTISSRGEYFFPVSENKDHGRENFQMSSYDLYAPRWAWPPDVEFKGLDENPSAAGEFVWTGFDYIGEPTPYNNDSTNALNFSDPQERARVEAELKQMGRIRVPSRSSYFGIIDLAGFPKDRFYIYQARWRPELPMVHVLPHWNWPERVGQVTPVHVYTSGDEAELFLNGRSLGRRVKAPLTYRLRWDDVVYEPGELNVVAYKAGNRWAETTTRTTGPATRLKLSADRTAIAADGDDLAFLTLSVTDDAGLTVPRSSPRIRFTIDGPGEIVATDNGNAIDHEAFQSPDRTAYNGLALAIIRAKPGAVGPITVTAMSDGLRSATATINSSGR